MDERFTASSTCLCAGFSSNLEPPCYLICLAIFLAQRFENIFGGKIDRHVHFEERLGLAGHMCRASKVFSCIQIVFIGAKQFSALFWGPQLNKD